MLCLQFLMCRIIIMIMIINNTITSLVLESPKQASVVKSNRSEFEFDLCQLLFFLTWNGLFDL